MDVLRQIVEWRSPSFANLWDRLFLLQIGVAILALVRRPRYRAALPLVVFTAAALLGVRNVGVASLVLVPGHGSGPGRPGDHSGRRRRSPGGRRGRHRPRGGGGAPRAVGAGRAGLRSLVVPGRRRVVARPERPADLGAADGQPPTSSATTSSSSTAPRRGRSSTIGWTCTPSRSCNDFLVLQHGRAGVAGGARPVRSVDLVLWQRNLPLTGLLGSSRRTGASLYQERPDLVGRVPAARVRPGRLRRPGDLLMACGGQLWGRPSSS